MPVEDADSLWKEKAASKAADGKIGLPEIIRIFESQNSCSICNKFLPFLLRMFAEKLKIDDNFQIDLPSMKSTLPSFFRKRCVKTRSKPTTPKPKFCELSSRRPHKNRERDEEKPLKMDSTLASFCSEICAIQKCQLAQQHQLDDIFECFKVFRQQIKDLNFRVEKCTKIKEILQRLEDYDSWKRKVDLDFETINEQYETVKTTKANVIDVENELKLKANLTDLEPKADKADVAEIKRCLERKICELFKKIELTEADIYEAMKSLEKCLMTRKVEVKAFEFFKKDNDCKILRLKILVEFIQDFIKATKRC